MILHHLLSLGMICFHWHHEECKQLILTEISTPFLVLYHLEIAQTVNKILFVFTFFYFRIYNLYTIVRKRRYEIDHPEIWLFFSFFVLNCWWAEKIVRKLVPPSVKQMLRQLTPYSHFLILSCLGENRIRNGFLILSTLASFMWHQYKRVEWYVLDLFCFHSISFLSSLHHVPSNLVWLSIPFHVADVFFFFTYHQLWLLASIGYDVILIFLFLEQDFVWLFGWILIVLLLRKQTLGNGFTQTLVHILCASLIYHVKHETITISVVSRQPQMDHTNVLDSIPIG